MKPTLKTVKASPFYLAYVERVEKLWPGRPDDFARELQVAIEFEGAFGELGDCPVKWELHNSENLSRAFRWHVTPQGATAWMNFDRLMTKLNGVKL